MTNRVCFLFAAVATLALALGACSNSPGEDPLVALRDQAVALEKSHHERARSLAAAVEIRVETEQYAQAMHGVLEDMEDACDDMDHGNMMMGGHSWDDMRDAMHRMEDMVEEHRRHIGGMDDLDAMRAECEEHHRLMTGGMDDLDAAMTGDMGMHRPH